MKTKTLLLFLLIQTWIYCEPHDPLIVVTIMIKNEAHSIEDTLKPLVEGGIDAYLIFDTGSTDNTLECVNRFFQKNSHVQYFVKQEPFIDFATSRNRSIELTKELYPEAEFIVMPDAEWILQNTDQLVQFCKNEVEKQTTTPAYLIRIITGSLDFYQTRMIRRDSNCRYFGKVHEVILPCTSEKVPSEVIWKMGSYREGFVKSQERWKRDRVLLEKSVEENPKDSRSLFYLAQTCACLGDSESAYYYYKIRKDLIGWPEEDFITLFRLGQVCQALSLKDSDKLQEAIYWYLEAFQKRPTRAEPLIALSDIYLKQGKHSLSFIFAKKAYETEYPAQDILFVDKHMYDYIRHDILSQCAWYVNEKEIGFKALKKAMEIHPDFNHLKVNYNLYSNR